ncbi:MAG: hypothetical protein ACXWXB_05305 [Actinomycetota bacterium]
MPTVRCPSCKTAQPVDAASHGYTCSSCGKQWGFVVCRSCGSRFHSKPGATTWTCPKCGLLQDASAEPPPPEVPEPAPAGSPSSPTPMTITDAVLDQPAEQPASAFPPGLGLGNDDEGPQDAFAMPVRESSGRPTWVWIVAALVGVALLVVLFNLMFGGDDGGGAASPTPSEGTGQVSVEEAIATMCGHVQQSQVLRDQALAAAQDTLKADAKALKQAGDPQAAKQVRALIAATGDLRQALADQADTADELLAQGEAVAALPCGA